jgi:hypothetical protein
MKKESNTYKFATGEEVAKTLVSAGQRKADQQMERIWKQAGRVQKEHGGLDELVQMLFGPAYEAAKNDGRKQITIADPTNLRRVSIKHQKRITLDDAAWAAKGKIDAYIEEHTRLKVDEDTRNILGILKTVFTGSKKLTWNASIQAFLDLKLEDAGLREAQRIIKGAKRTETSRDYTVLEERPNRDADWVEVVRY